uniref:Uncharacterized protein n=1 Tax=Arundo donax TaxID=35708 RepID=A0A0A8ZIY2_ARUDO
MKVTKILEACKTHNKSRPDDQFEQTPL